MAMSDEPTPFDRPAVERWLGLTPPVAWSQLTGGHSNFTFRIRDAEGRELVLRRPPLGPLLPKAHDMVREWTVLSGLAPTRVPVPGPVAFCDDNSVTGAPFYAMGAVEGVALLTAADFAEHVPPLAAADLAASMIDTLAALHRLQPDAIGLGALGKHDGYLDRQIASWSRGWAMSAAATGIVDARFDTLREALHGRLPVQQNVSVVHGDYGFHNCLIGRDHRVAAVIDWEICSLGDPLADLGYLLTRWPGEPRTSAAGDASYAGVGGFPDLAWATARYADGSGFDLGNLDFYLAFNFWKTAAIAHGVYARYASGQKAPPAEGLAQFTDMIDRSLTFANQLLPQTGFSATTR